jgi:hypothetical protein
MPLNMLCIINHLPKPYTQDLLNKALLFVLVNSWHPIHGTQFKNSIVSKLDPAIQQAINTLQVNQLYDVILSFDSLVTYSLISNTFIFECLITYMKSQPICI